MLAERRLVILRLRLYYHCFTIYVKYSNTLAQTYQTNCQQRISLLGLRICGRLVTHVQFMAHIN